MHVASLGECVVSVASVHANLVEQVWGGVQLEVERVFEKLIESKDGKDKVMETSSADHATISF